MRIIKEILVWLGIMLEPIPTPVTLTPAEVRAFGKNLDPVCFALYEGTRVSEIEFGLRSLLGHGLWDEMVTGDDGSVVSRVANWLVIEDDNGFMEFAMYDTTEDAEQRLSCITEVL